jgi:hypothetical protein
MNELKNDRPESEDYPGRLNNPDKKHDDGWIAEIL